MMSETVLANYFTTGAVGTAAGFMSSLLLFILSAVSVRFRNVSPETKQLYNIVMIALVSTALFGLSCTQSFSFTSCDAVGGLQAIILFGSTVYSNAGVYKTFNHIFDGTINPKVDELLNK